MEKVEGWPDRKYGIKSAVPGIMTLSVSQDEDLRPSDDPGRYLCDFTYYSSMVEYWRRDHKSTRPVMFLHVPGGTTDQDIARGKKVALGLIEALVASKQELSAKQDLSA